MFAIRRHSVRIRVLSTSLVAFMLLASARELVPGLCATLAAAKDGGRVCLSGGRSCCTGALASTCDSPGAIVHTLARPHPPCAFCNLVHGLAPLDASVAVPDDPARPEIIEARATVTIRSACLCAESRPRDPPLSNLS